MNDIEFDIIDELYFVTAFNVLQVNLPVKEEELCANLKNLLNQGYVKCFFPDPDTEIEFQENEFEENYRFYYFLATKAGLLAHNTR